MVVGATVDRARLPKRAPSCRRTEQARAWLKRICMHSGSVRFCCWLCWSSVEDELRVAKMLCVDSGDSGDSGDSVDDGDVGDGSSVANRARKKKLLRIKASIRLVAGMLRLGRVKLAISSASADYVLRKKWKALVQMHV